MSGGLVHTHVIYPLKEPKEERCVGQGEDARKQTPFTKPTVKNTLHKLVRELVSSIKKLK